MRRDLEIAEIIEIEVEEEEIVEIDMTVEEEKDMKELEEKMMMIMIEMKDITKALRIKKEKE